MHKIIELPYSSDNVLGFIAPETYHCSIRQYTVSHSELRISIGKETQNHGERCELLVVAVHYFELPKFWIGANFKVASFDETLAFLHTLHKMPEDSEHSLMKRWRLLSVESGRIPIKILTLAEVVQLEAMMEYEPYNFKQT